jgi:hypothetical protein
MGFYRIAYAVPGSNLVHVRATVSPKRPDGPISVNAVSTLDATKSCINVTNSQVSNSFSFKSILDATNFYHSHFRGIFSHIFALAIAASSDSARILHGLP